MKAIEAWLFFLFFINYRSEYSMRHFAFCKQSCCGSPNLPLVKSPMQHFPLHIANRIVVIIYSPDTHTHTHILALPFVRGPRTVGLHVRTRLILMLAPLWGFYQEGLQKINLYTLKGLCYYKLVKGYWTFQTLKLTNIWEDPFWGLHARTLTQVKFLHLNEDLWTHQYLQTLWGPVLMIMFTSDIMGDDNIWSKFWELKWDSLTNTNN